MSPASLTPSPQGLDFIKRYQGLSLEKYQDPNGLWVIGYGHLIRDHETFAQPITRLQAESLFMQDVSYYRQVLNRCVQVPLAQNQCDALMSLAFSLGPEAIQLSAVVHCVNRREYREALVVWRSEAQQHNSLAILRQAELALFQTDMR